MARWATLCLLPYAIVQLIINALAAPAFVAWIIATDHGTSRRNPDTDADLAVGVGITAVLSAAAIFLGHRAGLRFIRRRRDRLVEFRNRPELG